MIKLLLLCALVVGISVLNAYAKCVVYMSNFHNEHVMQWHRHNLKLTGVFGRP
ncbi:hypothetical protein [Escherichia phage UPEC01]|nr:hypothetical protein [Escherichia phage UPEC01]QUL77466.1 hypothetical protein [Escherichia phage UPEC07]